MNEQPTERKSFWYWAKWAGGTAMAVSGAVLGLPVILASAGIAIAIPGVITSAASVIGAVGTATAALAEKVEPTNKPKAPAE